MSQPRTEGPREHALNALAEFDEEWATEPAAPRLRRLFVQQGDDYQRLVARIERATGTPLPCLVEGPPASEAPALVALTIHQTGSLRSGPFLRVRGFLAPREWGPSFEAARGGSLLISEAQMLSEESQRRLLEHLAGDGPRILVTATAADDLHEGLARRLAVLRIAIGARKPKASKEPTPPSNASLEAIERKTIAARLHEFRWQMQRTAASLGIDRKTLYRKIKRYGLQEES